MTLAEMQTIGDPPEKLERLGEDGESALSRAILDHSHGKCQQNSTLGQVGSGQRHASSVLK